jgi:tRNA modification GTPase
VRRAYAEMQRADRVLFVVDAAADPSGAAYRQELGALPAQVPVTLLFNKCDLVAGLEVSAVGGVPPRLALSALTGAGLPELRAHLKSCMGYQGDAGGAVSARRRHLEALGRAREHVEEAARQLTERRAGELVAEELRAAQQHLSEITGEFTSEDLLARIFAGFCIGK